MVTLANGFAARGYAVDLVLASAVGSYLKDVAPAVRVVDLRAGRVIKACGRSYAICGANGRWRCCRP